MEQDAGYDERERWIEHAQHLLRHLNNPLELRNNPLAAKFKPRAIHGLLAKVCALMAEKAGRYARDSSFVRQYEIFRRCDIGGEAHAAVASTLGISRRQFYRERRLMARWVADFLLEAPVRRLVEAPATRGPSARMRRLIDASMYSDRLQASARNDRSRKLDARVRRVIQSVLTSAEHQDATILYVVLGLARRELRRGNLRAAMNDLDAVSHLASAFTSATQLATLDVHAEVQ